MQQQTQPADSLVDHWLEYFGRYEKNAIGELARGYPRDRDTLYVEYQDLVSYDVDFADDFLTAPQSLHDAAEDALQLYDLPIDISLENARVRVVGLPDGEGSPTYRPGELRAENSGEYVAIRGELDAVTFPDQTPMEATFICQRCGQEITIPMEPDEFQEPYQCPSCERQGPYKIDDSKTEWEDYANLRVTNPADADMPDASIEGYVTGSLIDEGGEQGLKGRVGERMTVYGYVETREANEDGMFKRVIRAEAFDFDADEDTVDINAHREAFEELAADSPIETWEDALGNGLYGTPAWKRGFRFGIVFLFGAPRVEIPEGATFRGDPHMLIVSDYGTGKSSFKQNIELYSPKCVSRSATGLSSDAGLTSAAVEDDFGAGQWAIKPGILPRANGGHVILDEIDKTDANLSKMNDAIEGRQQVDVEKAGQSVTFNSRCGLLALANPKDGKFDPMGAVGPQIGLDASLLSRFDAIITMEDLPDEEIDSNVAGMAGGTYKEGLELEYGDRENQDLTEKPIPEDVGKAWVKYARENVHPTPTAEQIERIRDWYATEVRPLNDEYGDTGGNGGDMPVPTTARQVLVCIRAAIAFSRCRLSETVSDGDVERAMQLVRELVGQTWKDGHAVPHEVASDMSQKDEYDGLKEVLRNADGGLEFSEIVAESGLDSQGVEYKLEKLMHKGEVYEPETGVYEWT